jgi:hypothetical protein
MLIIVVVVPTTVMTFAYGAISREVLSLTQAGEGSSDDTDK